MLRRGFLSLLGKLLPEALPKKRRHTEAAVLTIGSTDAIGRHNKILKN